MPCDTYSEISTRSAAAGPVTTGIDMWMHAVTGEVFPVDAPDTSA